MFEEILHDSHRGAHRSPLGASAAGGEVTLFLRFDEYLNVNARLRLWIDGAERFVEGRRADGGLAFSFAPANTGLVWYCFIIDAPGGAKWYGARTPGLGGAGALYDYPPPSWQITVYDAAFETPRRFRGGLAYQIFPDRFARSGRDDVSRYGYHLSRGRPLLAHKSWDEPVLHEPLPGNQDYDPCDFYGGDLAGIEGKLPYLKGLGVTCIYLNPVFEAASNHRYNTADYMRVDPMLGGDEALASLAKAAKAQGIELMLDGVFSHTGDDSVYFDRRGVYAGDGAYRSKDSPYAGWYEFYSWPESYRCWWGFKSLPEVNEDEPGYRDFVGRVLARYAAMGIGSWRLDVADELPDGFIEFLRDCVKRNDPEGTLIGEVWEDASTKEDYGARRAFVDGRELDGVMNYPFRAALIDFLLYRMDARGLCLRLETLRENYPKPFYEACLNVLGTHDTPRLFTVLSGAPGRDALTRREQARYQIPPDAAARGRARLCLAVMVQLAHPGVPCVYYGDEAGLCGMADPFNRATYPWGREDGHILSRYRLLLEARAECAAMREGLCGFAAPDGDVFALLRSDGDSCAMALVNRSESARQVSISASDFTKGPDAGKLFLAESLRDVLTGAAVDAKGGFVNLVLPPLSGALLTRRADE
ncbi:MAG: Amylopullulanase precursor [Firmicutes bacterium ADurb.Bin248]|nr:MAG: Amylopullulanase precursor [Firmicutes bacterium ADurb.Bin248]HPK16217.1 glycoside hydrolase family 13 protein [Clostridia bacterium]